MNDELKSLRNKSELKLKLGEDCVLITGSTDDDSRKLIYKHLFDLEYISTQRIYKNNKFTIIDYSDFNRSSFKFEQFRYDCNKIENNLHSIICIENLNPRPETMLCDIKILKSVFSTHDLKKYLYFICTPSQDKSLQKVREEFLKLNDFFLGLNINGELKIKKFVQKKIWILNKRSIDLYQLKSKLNSISIYQLFMIPIFFIASLFIFLYESIKSCFCCCKASNELLTVTILIIFYILIIF